MKQMINKKILVPVLVVCCFAFGIVLKNIPIFRRTISGIQLDTTNLQIDVGSYNITSTPIGIGEYSIKKASYGDNAELCINVKKTTGQPWCGAATLEWDLFDAESELIGKSVASSSSLLENDTQNIMFSFKMNENGKITYNQKEIYKIVLSSVTEEDDLHDFKISNFTNQKYRLEKYIEENNIEGFKAELRTAREEYGRDEFPEQNQILDSLESQVLNNDEESKNTVQSQNAQNSEQSKNTGKNNEISSVSYKKFHNDFRLARGDKIFVNGQIGSMEFKNIDGQPAVSLLLNDQWYMLKWGDGYGMYMRDYIEDSFDVGGDVGVALVFEDYWNDSQDISETIVGKVDWFTPPDLMDGGPYLDLPIYDGQDIYSWDVYDD